MLVSRWVWLWMQSSLDAKGKEARKRQRQPNTIREMELGEMGD